ncbi:hypothetical protein [Enemella sp. A6]|uniref:hypothetical protein n=1 Tax=Enemella sp. A6 TaxID=3440152 RepID=UPI003EC00C57
MKRRSVWAITMISVMAFVGCAGAGADTPTPTPTSTPSASDKPSATPTPTPTPESEEERAATDAIDTYKAFIHAAHAFLNDPDNQSVEDALVLTTDDGSARSGLLAEASQIEESGFEFEGVPTIKRAAPTSIDVEAGVVILSACVDVRALRVNGEAAPDRPDFFIESPELHRVNGRWLVHKIDGEPGSC